jgi:putative SOS response-associated peptidase YedK
MCGRFVLISDLSGVVEVFPVAEDSIPPRRSFNIAPGSSVSVILREEKQRLVLFPWGYPPPWAGGVSAGKTLINARAETAAVKPAFRKSFLERRCLILSNGYYEWKKEGKTKIPYFIHLEGKRLFAFAGIFNRRDPADVPGVAILTTEPAPAVGPIHDRMPVILTGEAALRWLEPAGGGGDFLQSLLGPYRGKDLAAYPVSRYVNLPAHDSPACIAPLEPGDPGARSTNRLTFPVDYTK